jgi:MFS transporter, PAT family, beta-lactamase induction signal transducer AmpG
MSKVKERKERRNPWTWLPSLYFAEGVPYVIVMTVSVVMYKRLGISNTDIALYTSWLNLPWVIKFVWSPFIDIFKTKRFWIIVMQLFIGAGLAGVAFTIPVHHFFQYTLAFFWLLAFSSATQDIAIDGFYMLGLNQQEQSFFVGIRSTFYRIAMLTGQGLIVILAGHFESTTGLEELRMQVSSKPGVESSQNLQFDSLRLSTDDQGKTLRFESLEKLYIGTLEAGKKKTDSLLSFAGNWNQSHGFLPPASNEAKNDNRQKGWWKHKISVPLSHWIQNNFGEKKELAPAGSLPGNIAVGWLKLTGPHEPGKKIIATVTRTEGDKNINLVVGSRLEFTDSNYTQPACVVFQLDPKSENQADAVFTVRSGNIPLSWSICFVFMAGLFVLFFIYHRFMVPYPASDQAAVSDKNASPVKDFFEVFADFFRKKDIILILSYLLLYRFAEAQLVKMSVPFMLDSREVGGLGLSTGNIGLIYGTIGMLALTIGGILGGIMASRNGLRYWLWWMILAMNLPIVAHLYLSFFQPESLWTISSLIALEQFGYGFGFTAYMIYMIFVSQGRHKTAHFAITTGVMALGMMLPGMMSGWLQELVGYRHFFVWVILCTIPGFIVTAFLKIDSTFGMKKN